MKKILGVFAIILIMSLCISAGLWYYFEMSNSRNKYSVSPLPDFLTLSKNNQVTLLDVWFPSVQKAEGSGFEVENLTAKSVLVYDLTTDKTIFEKSSSQKLPMASLTKIMTAIVALENRKISNRYVVSQKDIVGEDSMGLSAGEILSFDDLLYGLMLPSGNDAAEVLANNYPTGRAGFIKAMNLKASSLGLSDTQFDNPSGLQGDGVQYTTAYDLLIMTRYALENYLEFDKVVSTSEYHVPQSPTHKAYDLYNETNLLSTYDGVKGVKTGYTPEAGLCLVTYLDYKGHKIIGILLNSENRRGDMKNLLDNTLKSLGITPPLYRG